MPAWAQEFFSVSGQIFLTVLALLCCCGPLVPLATTLFFKKASVHCFRQNRSLLFALGSIHGLGFVPYLLAELSHQPEAYLWLVLPFAVGAIMFFSTLVYCLRFVISAIKGHLEAPVR